MIGYTVFGFLAALIFRTLLRMENSRRERGERNEVIVGSGFQQGDVSAKNGCYESIEAAQKEKEMITVDSDTFSEVIVSV